LQGKESCFWPLASSHWLLFSAGFIIPFIFVLALKSNKTLIYNVYWPPIGQ
jgi:hypothetical protein